MKSLGSTLYWWRLPTAKASTVTACTWQPKHWFALVQAVASRARKSSPRWAARRAAGLPETSRTGAAFLAASTAQTRVNFGAGGGAPLAATPGAAIP